eukprot:GFUD01039958.1.p1 GENE.GFUD01039958.1~~GFUD01039958.1.p1  ORF type:complete len:278 (-),score=48.78 GFUD01039958.1:14-847(-)
MVDPNFQTTGLVASLRDVSPRPTCDISFTFSDKTTGEKSELFAHKLILACGSPVFMAQFYGDIKEEKDSIPVEDSSIEAFKVFLDVLYNKEVPLKDMDFQFLGEFFYLADKYHLDLLKNSIVREVSSRKIVVEEVLEAAKVAEIYAPLEEFSNSLHHICSSFVRANLERVLEVFEDEEVGEDSSPILHRLMARASRSKPKPRPVPICKNCEQDPCLNGLKFTKENIVLGALMSRVGNPMFSRTAVACDNDMVYYYPGNGDTKYYEREPFEVLMYKCK